MNMFENLIFKIFCKNKKTEYENLKNFKEEIEQLKNDEALGVVKLNTLLKEKIKELDSLNLEIQNKTREKNLLKEKAFQLKKELDLLDELSSFAEFGLYEPKFDFAFSSQYKDALANNRKKQKAMIKEKTAMICTTEWNVNGSKREGKKMTNNTIKIGLKSFNSDCDVFISKCKYNNFDRMQYKIEKSYKKINDLNKVNAAYISHQYLELKLDELALAYEYAAKKQQEKEELQEERRKEREEAKLKKEIEAKTKTITKEVTHYNNVLKVLEEKLLFANEDQKAELKSQIDEIQDKVANLNNEIEELDYRLENLGAGYVYIISNIGSFGKNVFKIGVTRRLEPLDRIAELSSASVPFKFEVNALIFDYNAYKLEKYLHTKFNKYRINLSNNRKEFFKLDLDMIENELKNYGELSFDFDKSFKSQEYFETLKIREQMEKDCKLKINKRS